MVNLISTLATLFLNLLGRYDKSKQEQIIKNYYDKLNRDACGVLVEQLGGKSQDTTHATTNQHKES